MKIIKSLIVAGMLVTAGANASETAVAEIIFSETPAKTVCIKHPEAADANKYFSTSTVVMFEVYKAGTHGEVAKMIKSLKSDSNVQSVSEGALTGDYQAITLTLKSAKDKSWFISEFKKAGLSHIKINNNPIVEIEKL
ncbi:MAG: hypothetical protein JWO32_1913 [Bacteroidetes bacterium]|nr:hypothetical protein [Bacteroidota bacterium]